MTECLLEHGDTPCFLLSRHKWHRRQQALGLGLVSVLLGNMVYLLAGSLLFATDTSTHLSVTDLLWPMCLGGFGVIFVYLKQFRGYPNFGIARGIFVRDSGLEITEVAKHYIIPYDSIRVLKCKILKNRIISMRIILTSSYCIECSYVDDLESLKSRILSGPGKGLRQKLGAKLVNYEELRHLLWGYLFFGTFAFAGIAIGVRALDILFPGASGIVAILAAVGLLANSAHLRVRGRNCRSPK